MEVRTSEISMEENSKKPASSFSMMKLLQNYHSVKNAQDSKSEFSNKTLKGNMIYNSTLQCFGFFFIEMREWKTFFFTSITSIRTRTFDLVNNEIIESKIFREQILVRKPPEEHQLSTIWASILENGKAPPCPAES